MRSRDRSKSTERRAEDPRVQVWEPKSHAREQYATNDRRNDLEPKTSSDLMQTSFENDRAAAPIPPKHDAYSYEAAVHADSA